MLTSCQCLRRWRSDSVIWHENHSKAPNNVPKGPDNPTKSLSEPLPRVRNSLTPSASGEACFGMGRVSAAWSPTEIQPVQVTRYKAVSYSAKLTHLIREVKFPGSVLDQVSLAPGAEHPGSLREQASADSTDFPNSQAWTVNRCHWNSHRFFQMKSRKGCRGVGQNLANVENVVAHSVMLQPQTSMCCVFVFKLPSTFSLVSRAKILVHLKRDKLTHK